MGFFGSKKEGGLMDVIRCDEKDFLVWKWSPTGEQSRRENEIRYGSSLRVKDGEVAVFVYKQKDGTMQDFIEGPFDQTIKTANFPILSSIVGSAFGGSSPFQAEIYFINTAGNVQIPFFINEFDVADSRFLDYTAPVTVKGVITFNITDYQGFIKLNRMIEFRMDEFFDQVKRAIVRYAKSVITNAPSELGIPLVQIERGIDSITTLVEGKLREALVNDFGVNVKRVDLSSITINKESEDYIRLREVTADLQTATLRAQTDIHIKNLADQQGIGAENYQESLRIQREETQRLQKLQTETGHLTAHQINIQGDVAKTAAQSLGELGGSAGSSMGDGGGGDGGGMNPAAMMTGMMMGGAVGSGMANMIGGMMQGVNQPQPPTPPAGAIAEYHVSVDGQQSGPYTLAQLAQLKASNQFGKETYVWKAGMANWEIAGNVVELGSLFAAATPPPPPPPPPPAPVPPPPPTTEE